MRFWSCVSIIFLVIGFLYQSVLARRSSNSSHHSLKCGHLKDRLFHGVEDIDRERLEWERYLPVFVKLSLYARSGVTVDSFSGGELEFPYGHERFDLLGPIGPSCKTPLERYGKDDEEKRICGLQQLKNFRSRRTGREDDCVIYSLGSNNTWGFETSIVKETNCRVETFDCTIDSATSPPADIAHRVRFHHVCVSDSDYQVDGKQFYSWKSINRLTGITTSPTFLKMDVEGYEFPILRAIIDAGEYLPLQIAVEFHYIRLEGGNWDNKRVSSLELYTFFQYLYRFGGYYLIDRRDNPICRHCTEVLLAKLNCRNYPLTKPYRDMIHSSSSFSTPQHPLFLEHLQKVVDQKYYG